MAVMVTLGPQTAAAKPFLHVPHLPLSAPRPVGDRLVCRREGPMVGKTRQHRQDLTQTSEESTVQVHV